MRIAGVVIATLLVSGCGHFDGVRESLGSPPMVQTEDAADLEAFGTDLDTLRSYLRRYDLVSSAQVLGLSTTDSDLPLLILPGSGSRPEFKVVLKPRANSSAADQYPALLQAYVAGRREQIDGLCSTYFDGLQTLSSGTQWGQDATNILFDTAGVLGGLTEASAKKLAVLSGLQVATNDTFDATKTALLISPAPDAVYALVRAKQDMLVADTPTPARFWDAERLVRSYALPCTQNGIRNLVSEAMQDRTRRLAEPPPAKDIASTLAPVAQVISEGGAPIRQLNAADAAALYWAFVLAPRPGTTGDPASAEQASALASFDTTTRDRVKTTLADPDRSQRVADALATVASNYGWVAVMANKQRTAYSETVRAATTVAPPQSTPVQPDGGNQSDEPSEVETTPDSAPEGVEEKGPEG